MKRALLNVFKSQFILITVYKYEESTTQCLYITIHPNNSINNITRGVIHSYKICYDNIWSPIGLLCLLQPFSNCLVASFPTGRVQVRERVEQDCLPVRGENAL